MVIYIFIYTSPLYHKFITIISLLLVLIHHFFVCSDFPSAHWATQPAEPNLYNFPGRFNPTEQCSKSCYSTRYHKYTYLKIYAYTVYKLIDMTGVNPTKRIEKLEWLGMTIFLAVESSLSITYIIYTHNYTCISDVMIQWWYFMVI